MNTTGVDDAEIAQQWEFLEKGAGPHQAAPGADLGIDPELLEQFGDISTASMLEPLYEVIGERVDPPLSKKEIDTLCKVQGMALDKWFPIFLANFGVEAMALGITFAIFKPRMGKKPAPTPEPQHATA